LMTPDKPVVSSGDDSVAGKDAMATGFARLLEPWPLVVVFALLMLVAVSHKSLWIDEAVTANLAEQPTLGKWWHVISTSGMTDVQMPLYTIFVWAFAKFFGVGEFPLRLAGALWLVPGLAAFVVSFPRGWRRLAAFLVAATNAFIWYYADEARTYAMQLGGSFLVFAALHRLVSSEISAGEERRWLYCFAFGLLVVCGSSMLGMIWAWAPLGAAWVLFPVERLMRWWRAERFLWVFLTLVLAVLGCYFLGTLRLGARGSNAGTTDWRTTAFILYDQLGFEGLGPGRTALRAQGVRALWPFAPGLLCYSATLAAIFFFALKEAWRLSPRKLAALAIVIVVPWGFLSVVGIVTHFRLLGRHSAPMMPLWLFLIANGMVLLASKPGWVGRIIVGTFLSLGLFSSLSVRFAYRQSKDDYRRASALAAAVLAERQDVWWSADEMTAQYYHLPVSDSAATPENALLMVNPSDATVEGSKQPQVIVVSRPDLYDNSGALARYMARRGFHATTAFPAFEIWTAPTSK
jgi:4-amino-4-deoxy-L-arabinose transferase-like glycosyltransferase